MRKKQTTRYTEEKLALDARLMATLAELGIVTSNSDLSAQMGRNTTYYACMRRRGYSLHLGSLVFYAAKLTDEMAGSTCVRERAQLRSAVTAINETIQAKCRLREQELLAE
jgi:hypothetical protein